ncbi:hypothetical protein AX17_007093 [Amanita inopinata Kibby_2008]|nr:hypothetical protein AX17_007093 [Amanita inopinata Kibby_2008]
MESATMPTQNPFANTTSKLKVISDDGKIDIEAEVYSKDIWLEDNSGTSLAFARDVNISGWTSVGDEREGAYIGNFIGIFTISMMLYGCPLFLTQSTTAQSKPKR